MSGRALRAFNAPLHRIARARISVPRQDRDRHHMRAHLLQSAENQSQHRLRRSERGDQTGERRNWLVSFMDYDLGYFDHDTCRLEPLENPFGPKVLPMSPE